MDHDLKGNNWHSPNVYRTAKTSKYGVYLSSWLDSSWLTENQLPGKLAIPNGKKFVVQWKQVFFVELYIYRFRTLSCPSLFRSIQVHEVVVSVSSGLIHLYVL